MLLASKSPPVKWPSMSPATAQSGCGVAAESSSQETMARHGNDDGCSGLTEDICPILHHGTGVGLESLLETVGQPVGSEQLRPRGGEVTEQQRSSPVPNTDSRISSSDCSGDQNGGTRGSRCGM